MKQMCSKKMKASLPFWLVYYKAPDFTDSVKKEILKMSHSTIDRILKPQRTQYGRRLRTGTKRNENWVENVIPVKALNFESDRPGMLQADTIAHCGGSMSGIFTWSLAMTDICSGWTCTRAMWNKTANSTFFALRKVEQLLPFKIAGFNVDNGTEFINAQLVYYAQRHPNGSLRENPLEITRSRAYRKNDNCYVEQKNFTHVREIFGYERFEFESLLEAMNEIYELDNDLQNFFVPQMKLIFKERIKSKYKKKYDKPQTPYRRILHSEFVSEEIKNTLRKKYQELNPFELTSLIEKKKKSFFEEYYKLTQCVARGSGYG